MTSPEDAFELCEKRLAILDGAGHALVLGGPGSGKTTIALLKARRRVIERLGAEQTVLFLSFSNAAIRRILESAGELLARDIGAKVEIRTYHSFAWDILRTHGYLLSSQRCLQILPAQDTAVIQAGLGEDEWTAEEVRLFNEDGRVTYDQFAPRAAELLERSKAVRDCYCAAHPLILVDEFQDTDEDQWRLIRAMSKGSDIIGLGDTEQQIYAWRKGVSATRLEEFASSLDAKTYNFGNENNRSPATGIAGYARSLLSPNSSQELPEDIVFKRHGPGRFDFGVRFGFIETWNETAKRSGRQENKIAIAARSKTLVRLISDALAKKMVLAKKQHHPVAHDVMFDQMQVALASRVVAYVLASIGSDDNERIAGALERVSNVLRSAGKTTAIRTSDKLLRWAENCREGNAPRTKCVKALVAAFAAIDEQGLTGSPTEDWLTARRALELVDSDELKRTADHARYLRLLRRGSSIEEQLATLWRDKGSYAGAEEALEGAMLQEQLTDNHRETSNVSVMTMHQLKGREYDGILLVEDKYRTFRGREQTPPFMETRRLLQVSLTRARHFAFILSATENATLNVLFPE